VIARAVADQMGIALGQPIIIENVAGSPQSWFVDLTLVSVQ
jgi:hypothetical protein